MPAGKRGPRKTQPAPAPAASSALAGAPRSNNRYASIQLGVAAALAEELAELRAEFPLGHWSVSNNTLILTDAGKEYEFEFGDDKLTRAVLLLLNNISLITDVLRKKAHVSQD